MALLDVDRLTTAFPIEGRLVSAVSGVSFTLDAGETLALVGESGCGKSLTALSILRLVDPPGRIVGGAVRLEGRDLLTLDERAMRAIRGREIGLVLQEPMTALNPVYTIGDQLTEGYRRHRGGGGGAARERAVFLLEKVGISSAGDRLRQYPHQLSGGLRQRVMIAMALMCDPKLLIADEPTTALDVTVQAQILRLLAGLQRDLGLGMLLITHDLGIVARVAHHVSVMYAGEVVESAPTAELFANPKHPYTQGLLRCVPAPGKIRRDEPLGSIPGTVPRIGPGF
jgi:peptide/nickel transport system ATP-binding protein